MQCSWHRVNADVIAACILYTGSFLNTLPFFPGKLLDNQTQVYSRGSLTSSSMERFLAHFFLAERVKKTESVTQRGGGSTWLLTRGLTVRHVLKVPSRTAPTWPLN